MRKDLYDEVSESFKKLVGDSYDHIYEHPEHESTVDDLVNFVSKRFSNEPNYAVVIAVWNAMNNCVNDRPNVKPVLQ